MREAQSKTIGSRTYEVRMLGARDAFRMYGELMKMLAPSIGSAIGRVDTLSKDVSQIIEVLFVRFAADFDSPKVYEIVNKMAGVTLVTEGGEAVQLLQIIDTEFAGDMPKMIQWLMFALEVNFGSFFDSAPSKLREVLANLAALGKKVASPSQATSPMNGPSGASGSPVMPS